jgi:predicted ATPase/DNA-binding SARP family transcriptional activator
VQRLKDDLWDGDLPASAASTLKSHISHLRHSLGPDRLASRDGGYQLRVEPGELDVTLFENDVATGRELLRAGDARAAAEVLGLGLRRWRGAALADVADTSWGQPDAVRLEELRAAALESWLEARLALGESREVIADAESAVAQYPLREQFWAKLITALYHSARQADALRACRRLRELLIEELGITPSADLIKLEEAILRQELEPTRVPDPPRRAVRPERTTNLPPDLTSFVPRPREQADLAVLLTAPGLVTLTGAGGTGKTRLAIQVARDVAGAYEGVWFCELAAVDDYLHLLREVATAVDRADQPGVDLTNSIAERFENGHHLLLLDNCERILDAVADLCFRLRGDSPQLHLLATSLSPLGVDGEIVCHVPPLSVPGDVSDPDEALMFESVDLFIERARHQQPTFRLDRGNCRAVAAVCSRLDGIPLALELAAARMRTMSVTDIERRLDDRFRLLTGGARTAPARQRTLKALIDWSYDLMNDHERITLGRLAAFANGFDLEATEAVMGTATLDVVSSLVDKSLVQVDTTGLTTRYRMLETVREYAAATLTDEEQRATRATHARHFLRVIESAAPHFSGSGQLAWRDRLQPDEENLRAAFASLLAAGGAQEALRFGAAISKYWNSRGIYGDDMEILEAALERDDAADPTPARGGALAAAGYLHFRRGEAAKAQARLDEAATIARAMQSPSLMADVLRTMAWVAERRGDHDAAAELAGHAVGEALASGNTNLIARAFDVQAAATQHRDPDRARSYYGEALRYCHAVGDALGRAGVLNNLAVLELEQGDHRAARAYFIEALTLTDEVREAALVPFLEYGVGLAAALDNDYAAAESAFVSAMHEARRTGQKSLVAYALLGVAVARGGTGWDHDAATLLGASAALFDEVGEQPERIEAALRDRVLASLSATLGDRLDGVVAAGQRLATPEILRLVACDRL